MKVGTDGVLLGAWARGGQRILDVGCGTGLIALMMAQRFPQSSVCGIDINAEAVAQAADNFRCSPFSERLSAELCDVACHEGTYDAVVSNPPYFEDSLTCPDDGRTMARHGHALSFGVLFDSVCRLLDDGGTFSLVVPDGALSRIEAESTLHGLFLKRHCAVRTTPRKAVSRHLLTYSRHSSGGVSLSEGVIETMPGKRSEWYESLTGDFYLK